MNTMKKNSKLMLPLLIVILLATTAQAVRYEYDALGRVTLIIYDNGQTVAYSYDSAGNITAIDSAGRCSSVISGRIGETGRLENFRFHGEEGESITLRFEAKPRSASIGKFASIRIHLEGSVESDAALPLGDHDECTDMGSFQKKRHTALPTQLTAVLPATGSYHIHVKSEEKRPPRPDLRYTGAYELTLEGSSMACSTFESLNGDGEAVIVTDGDSDDWLVRLRVSSGGHEDHVNYLGVALDASAGWDALDGSVVSSKTVEPLLLYFPHADWEENPGRYNFDIRGSRDGKSKRDGFVWHFDMEKNFSDHAMGDEVRLDFSEFERVPSAYQILLVDLILKRKIDLRREPSYAFFAQEIRGADDAADARFRVFVGNEDFIASKSDEIPGAPQNTRLAQNSPNPFNPRTIIQYELAQTSKVWLAVYDVRGALVKTLVDRELSHGGYQAVWLGDDQRGRPVASGIYYYRLSAGDFLETRKMVLLK